MRNAVLLLILLWTLASCSNQRPIEILDVPIRTVVTGKVLNPISAEPNISLVVNRVGFEQDEIEVPLDGTGNFKMEFAAYIPVDAWISYHLNFLVLLRPGDSLHIEFDAAQQDRPEVLETVRFEGTPAEDNRQAATFQKLYFASDLYINGHDATLRCLENAFKMYEPDRFRLFADSIRQAGIRFLNAFTRQYKPNDLVQSWATFFINSDYYGYMTSYPGRHRKANVLEQSEWSVSISYYDYFKEHPYEIESGLHSAYAIGDFLDKYLAFMHAIVREELKGHAPEEAEQLWDSLVLNAIVTNTESNSLRENVLAFELAFHFMEDDVETFEQCRSLIEANVQSAYVRIPLFEKYETTKKKVEKQMARDYSAVESLDRLLDGIIRRNRGKVTYVDIWATWCGPCIEEFPYSKKLQQEFPGDKVSFVYVCIESKQNSYEKALREFKLGGAHYLLEADQSAELRKVLEIEGIPRYMLIDANGKLVSIRWRPSDDATKGEITKLIVGE